VGNPARTGRPTASSSRKGQAPATAAGPFRFGSRASGPAHATGADTSAATADAWPRDPGSVIVCPPLGGPRDDATRSTPASPVAE